MATITFGAVGDISLGDHPLCAGFGTHSVFKEKNPQDILAHVVEVFGSSDILFGNLECTVSEIGLKLGDYHSVQMRGQPSYVRGLREGGFNVLNIANNHAMQHGELAFRETRSLLIKENISVCGVAADNGAGAQLTVLDIHGIRVGVLGYSLRPRQYFTQRPLYAEGNEPAMLMDVSKARQQCDIVIVSVHWGDEFIDRPSPEEIRLARELVDAGANLIVGHHPHVLRGIERYGKGIILYSLGNFVCDMLWDSTLRESAVFRCQLNEHGVFEPELIPIWINETSQPTIALPDRANHIQRRIEALSSDLEQNSRVEDSESYRKAAARVHARIRVKSHLYFLKNIYRYPFALLSQNIANFIRNRAKELKDAVSR